MKLKKPVTVYILYETDEGDSESRMSGVFSTRELAEYAHNEFENLYPPHWPQDWHIEEVVIDSQIAKLKKILA
jgi:hypothetical protein